MREKGARAVVVLYLRPCPEPEHCPREVFLLHDGHPGGMWATQTENVVWNLVLSLVDGSKRVYIRFLRALGARIRIRSCARLTVWVT